MLFGKFLHCQAASIGFHDVFHAIRSAIERILTLYVSKFPPAFCHNIEWYQFGITRANTMHARMLKGQRRDILLRLRERRNEIEVNRRSTNHRIPLFGLPAALAGYLRLGEPALGSVRTNRGH